MQFFVQFWQTIDILSRKEWITVVFCVSHSVATYFGVYLFYSWKTCANQACIRKKITILYWIAIELWMGSPLRGLSTNNNDDLNKLTLNELKKCKKIVFYFFNENFSTDLNQFWSWIISSNNPFNVLIIWCLAPLCNMYRSNIMNAFSMQWKLFKAMYHVV